MKFTLSWLNDYLETTASLEEICAKLTSIGLELEGVEDRGEIYAPFKVALIEEAIQHPNADRLKLLTVNTGEEKLQVVCGAPNARTGMKGLFAPVGSYIPGLEFKLKKGKIRGEESNGMMVSEKEMLLSDEHDGIIEVSDDLELGTPMADIYGLNDPIIDIAITPNRADATGVYGVARDLAASGLGTLKEPNRESIRGSGPSTVTVTIEDTEACPLFLGRTIKGVKNEPSPQWLQDRLTAIGLRPISTLVDITNYITHDLARPLHVFDTDKLQGNIHVRMAKSGETLDALNDTKYELQNFMTVVCDDSGVLGLGGIIGGTQTGCTETTQNVFLECAYFDPPKTAKTGRSLQIESDARYRFERGIDPDFTIDGIEIATRMIIDLCGGEASDVTQAGAIPTVVTIVKYTPEFSEKMIGMKIDAPQQKEILGNLGFKIEDNNGTWTITPPSYRSDIYGKADIVEEIARIVGYDNIPSVSVTRTETDAPIAETPLFRRQRMARATLASRGYQECVTWSFMGDTQADIFGANDNLSHGQSKSALSIKNPISQDLVQMRPTIIGNLLDLAKKNTDKGFANTALFEVGPIFTSSKPDGQEMVATGLKFGKTGNKHWSSTEANRPVDIYDAKADAIEALRSAGAPVKNLQISYDVPVFFHPGRSGALRLGKDILAVFGELHPAILDEKGIDEQVVGFEIFLEKIPKLRKKGTARPLLKASTLQPISRDFAFLVDQHVEANTLIRAAKAADKKLISDANIFDVYVGKNIEDGKKSVALSITLQPTEQTLTDKEIEGVGQKIIDAVAQKTGGILRG
ncbi:MAG: phenylalanine--tRNA ligase subunit beta [Alphaproteobacteria bacterium]|nr:phenylalanine--tRNA ligase subunit beta [Alphaproteobacteria bacterium]